MSYVRKNPDLERRKQRFFSGARDDVESNIIHNAMYKIGFFQLQENNLSHIKAVQASAEKTLEYQAK